MIFAWWSSPLVGISLDREALLAVEDHHEVDLDGGGHARERGEGGDDGEAREGLELAFVDGIEVGHAERRG